MASRLFPFLEKKHSKIRKRAAKHFVGLAALSPFQRNGGRRSRPGANPFISVLTVARCPAIFPGVWPQLRDTLSTSQSVGRRTGAFIYALSAVDRAYNTLHFASQSRVPIGGVAPFGNPHKKGGTLPLHGAHTAFSCYPDLRLYRLSKSQRGIGVVSLSK